MQILFLSCSFGIHTCSSVGLVLCFSLYIVFSFFCRGKNNNRSRGIAEMRSPLPSPARSEFSSPLPVGVRGVDVCVPVLVPPFFSALSIDGHEWHYTASDLLVVGCSQKSFEFGVFRLLVTELWCILRVMVLVGGRYLLLAVALDFWFALGLSAGFESHKLCIDYRRE
jgi:hypothetical protein